MTLRSIRPSFLLFAVALVTLALISALWIAAVPSVLSVSTFAFSAVVLIGAGIVTLSTWRSAKATRTVGQLLYSTEGAEPSGRESNARVR